MCVSMSVLLNMCDMDWYGWKMIYKRYFIATTHTKYTSNIRYCFFGVNIWQIFLEEKAESSSMIIGVTNSAAINCNWNHGSIEVNHKSARFFATEQKKQETTKLFVWWRDMQEIKYIPSQTCVKAFWRSSVMSYCLPSESTPCAICFWRKSGVKKKQNVLRCSLTHLLFLVNVDPARHV